MQSVVANTSHIRKHESLSKKAFDSRYLEMMNTQIVRNGQLSAAPFPFKYLREKNV